MPVAPCCKNGMSLWNQCQSNPSSVHNMPSDSTGGALSNMMAVMSMPKSCMETVQHSVDRTIPFAVFSLIGIGIGRIVCSSSLLSDCLSTIWYDAPESTNICLGVICDIAPYGNMVSGAGCSKN